MKLNQALAVERDIKNKATARVTERHKQNKKTALFEGQSVTFRKIREEAPDVPARSQRVQLTANGSIALLRDEFTRLFNVTAAKDYANCEARGSVRVGGKLILENVPATHLLWLEKKVRDIRTFITDLPILDGAYDWEEDANDGLFKTQVQEQASTMKVQEGIVLHPPTEHHPAQTQLITKDVVIGYKQTARHSGAIPASRKEVLVARVDEVLHAVAKAREEANASVDVGDHSVGETIFGYIFE